MDEGSILGVTSRGHRLKGSDRFPSLTNPKGMFRAATVPWAPQSTYSGSDSTLGHPSVPLRGGIAHLNSWPLP